MKTYSHTLSRAKQALRLFSHDMATKQQRRSYALQWLACIDTLGDKWPLANKQALVRINK